jgi:Zn-dependent M28 family amino/carboxypeptidase
VFIGFTGEESGLVGSRHYARTMTKEQTTRTDAMVNMDTLGLASTEIETGHSDKKLTSVLAYIAQKVNLPVTGVNVGAIGITDSQSFADRKIPSITIHSLTQEAWDSRILHSPNDRLSAIRMNEYYQTYCLVSAYLILLDIVLSSTVDAGSY